jgi:hypothetical protein
VKKSISRIFKIKAFANWVLIASHCLLLPGCFYYPSGYYEREPPADPTTKPSAPFSIKGLPNSVAIIWKENIEPEYDAKMSSLLIQKGFRVTERNHLNEVLDEIKFQQSGLTDESARKIAAFLNVDSILISEKKFIGSRLIDGFEYTYRVICKLVTLPEGQIVYSGVDCMLEFPTRALPQTDSLIQ